MKKKLIRLILSLTGWKMGGPPPNEPRFVMIGFPHTSNWDILLLWSYAIYYDMPLRFLAKKSVFWFPLGLIMRALGGVPVDRSKSNNLVEAMAEVVNRHSRIAVTVPPEGTRKKVPHLKSGFYHLALMCKIPIVPSYIDGQRRTFGTGPAIFMSGDVKEDMEHFRTFYGDMKGIYPQLTSEFVLKAEQEPANPNG